MDISTQAGEMRYHPETNPQSLSLEPPQPSPLLNLFHPPILNPTTAYPQDGGAFYQTAAPVYTGPDPRTRLGSSIPSTGMAHTHPQRAAALPHPGSHISARDQYSPATPTFRRPSEHHDSRSPSFPGTNLRRQPLSPGPNAIAGFTPAVPVRMDSNQYSNRSQQGNVPPLQDMQPMGTLQYADGNGTPAKIGITGTIDKGFFLSDNEWTCYRRNYFSCVCSFTLSPNFVGTPLQFTPTSASQAVSVYGFAMCISAVVSDNEQHNIELVQHTPKRDKGPIMKPEKVKLIPKQPPSSNPHLGMFQDGVGNPRSIYPEGYGAQANAQQFPTEHSFERIQFKQATQNNGKRRAAQQYYQLVVELWADVGGSHNSGPDQYVKIAQRKSDKMIVRGRSPGHYQNDRRNSQSNGPGGSAGSMGGYSTISSMGDFPSNPIMGPASYGGNFDGRGAVYGMRHHDLSPEGIMTPEDAKAIETTKEYQYYPGAIYGHTERVDMFHPRSTSDMSIPHMTTGFDPHNKVKHEYDGATLPSIFHPPPMISSRRPGPFEGKPTSSGYYPTVMPPPGDDMTMT